MDWRAEAEWLALGVFRDDHTFVFDRAAIADLLRRRLAAARDCPHLCAAYAEAALAALPSRAMPSERWRYRSASPGAPGSRRVCVRRVRHGAETHTDEVVDGLVPLGVRGAEPIVRRAMRRAARHDVNLKLLFEEANR